LFQGVFYEKRFGFSRNNEDTQEQARSKLDCRYLRSAWRTEADRYGARYKTDTVSATLSDNTFVYNPFINAYVDIGFDLSGRAGRTRGFGMVFRTLFSLTDDIIDSTKLHYEMYKQIIGISIVANYSFAVAAFPIGGK
jgi:hypothetical protein